MYGYSKFAIIVALIAALVGAPFPGAAAAPSPSSPPTAAGPGSAESESSEEREWKPEIGAIDEAGSKVGKKIEQFSVKASDRFGGWVSGKGGQNLTGIEIGPLLASLGISGLAVALAAKDPIATFLGTLTNLLDMPFQVGERIVIDNYDGVVENVGFRSTRIRLLTGHLVTIPNEKVVNSGLENIAKRPNIRWLSPIGITYDTPTEKIEKAVAIVRDILADHEGMHPDFPPRVYFNGFNDWSLNIMVLAWYHPPEYWDFQEWVQRTCLEITRRFAAETIDFAFPTRTLHLANDDKRQLKVEWLRSNANVNVNSEA